ncbi:hypothetical protein [Aliiglaciecola sp. NS0011-25]|uniref:hypothetical protein n=1 Tax=Aliiglaciecola sp. NS0011-25 TaxID=3127654 RepID=UPI003101C684
MLRDGWLYHSQPEAFNDPFDCKYHLRWPNALFENDELDGFLSDMQLVTGLNFNFMHNDVLSRAMEILKNDVVKGKIRNALNHEYVKVRVCCFTSTHDN